MDVGCEKGTRASGEHEGSGSSPCRGRRRGVWKARLYMDAQGSMCDRGWYGRMVVASGSCLPLRSVTFLVRPSSFALHSSSGGCSVEDPLRKVLGETPPPPPTER